MNWGKKLAVFQITAYVKPGLLKFTIFMVYSFAFCESKKPLVLAPFFQFSIKIFWNIGKFGAKNIL